MKHNANNLLYSGWFPISTAALMLSFWILYAIFLPMQKAYIYWVLDNDWTWINLVGFMGSLMGIFALNSIFLILDSKRITDFIGYFIGVSGIVILTATLFFEAFVLKGIALENPNLIDLNSGFYQDITFRNATL